MTQDMATLKAGDEVIIRQGMYEGCVGTIAFIDQYDYISVDLWGICQPRTFTFDDIAPYSGKMASLEDYIALRVLHLRAVTDGLISLDLYRRIDPNIAIKWGFAVGVIADECEKYSMFQYVKENSNG